MIEFGQPAALWTGLAIGLPILAHMAYRRITQKHAFPSLRFITPSQIPRTGRKTPTDLPLLLLRILLFITTMLLLADPYWSSSAKPENSSNEKELIIAMDISPSMGGWNGLEEAKVIAADIISNSEEKIGFVTFGKKIENEWPVGTDHKSLLGSLEGISHGWGSGDAQILADRVWRLFGENTPYKKLLVISDFQRSDWQSVDADLSNKGIVTEMIQVGAGNDEISRSDNRSIVESKVVPAGPGKVRIWSVVRNWTDEKKSDILELVIGGEVKEKQEVVLPAKSTKQVQFIVPTTEVSQAVIKLSNDDPMSLDNQRTVWLKAPPPKHFGFWHNTSIDEPTKSEKNFLKTAVESAGDNGWNRWEENEDNANGLRMELDDSKLELLVVIGMGNWFLEEGLATSMNAYLESGGVAVITPTEIFSETASIIREEEWMRFSFIRVVGGAAFAQNPFRIGALEQNSVLSEIFSGKAGRDLYLTSLRKFGMLKKVDDALRVELSDREGRPLALVKNFSSGGKLIFFPFRMNTSWSDLPLRTSFLPLLMELTKKNNQQDQTLPVLEVGELFGSGTEGFLAEKPGVYRHAGKWIEVVFPIAESITETLSGDEMKLRAGKLTNTKSTVEKEPSLSMNDDQYSLWLWFAILAGSLLTIEMIWSRPNSGIEQKERVSHA